MKTYALTLTVVSVLAANFAFAAPVEIKARSTEEIRRNMEKELKAGAKAIPKDVAQREQFRTNLAADVMKVSTGKIESTRLSAALNAKLTVNEGGKDRKLDMVEIAKSVVDAKATNERLNVESAEAKDLLAAQREAAETASEFLTLASMVSGKDAAGMNAFAKQMSLIPEMLSTMDAAAVKSHVEVMRLAIEIRNRNPEMDGDAAFVQALKDHFGAKWEAKLAELAGCTRSFTI